MVVRLCLLVRRFKLCVLLGLPQGWPLPTTDIGVDYVVWGELLSSVILSLAETIDHRVDNDRSSFTILVQVPPFMS